MNKDKLKKFCMLPTYRIEVEKINNPDKSCHRVYWEWVDEKKSKNIVVPKFKDGTWKLMVDVISAENVVRTFEAGDSDEAWNKLLSAAEAKGFKTTAKIEKTSCNIDLQNGVLKILARKITTDDGTAPEVKLIYADKDELVTTTFTLVLDNAKNLGDIAEVLMKLAGKF